MSLNARFGDLRAMLQPGAAASLSALHRLLRDARAADPARYDDVWLPYLRGVLARGDLPTLTMTRLRDWKQLAALLPEGAATGLDLSATRPGNGGIRTMHTALRLHPSLRLTRLSLRRGALDGGDALLALLRSPEVAALEALDLSENGAQTAHTILAIAESTHLSALRELNLRDVPLSPSSHAQYGAPIAPELELLLSARDGLERLDLSRADLPLRTIHALMAHERAMRLRALGLEHRTSQREDPLDTLRLLWAPGALGRARVREVCVSAFWYPLERAMGARERIPHEVFHEALDALGAGPRKLTTSQSGYGMWIAVESFAPP